MEDEQKQSQFDAMHQKMSKVTDKLGTPIDPGIMNFVVLLNMLGFQTDGSCEGHIDTGTGGPYIDISSPDIKDASKERMKVYDQKKQSGERFTYKDNIDRDKAVAELMIRIVELLSEFYNSYKPKSYGLQIVPRPLATWIRLECLETSVTRCLRTEERETKLRQFQEEFNAFESFARDKYFK